MFLTTFFGFRYLTLYPVFEDEALFTVLDATVILVAVHVHVDYLYPCIVQNLVFEEHLYD